MLEKIFPFLIGVNDLTNTHYPLRIFVRRVILENHTLPSFNPLIFGGRQILGDSLSDIFYPFFYLHVFLPFSWATLINLVIHLSISFLGIYLIARHISHARKSVAFVSGMIYVFMPKLFYHVTAGHLGMIEALAWLPLIFYFVLKVSAASYRYRVRDLFLFSLFCGLSALANYFIFYYIAIFIFMFWILEMLAKHNQEVLWKSTKFFFLTALIFLLIAGVQIVPAIMQLPHTLRESMRVKDILPFWSWRYLFQSIFFPFRALQNYEQEAFLYSGIIFYTACFWGIWKSRMKNKPVCMIMLFLMFNLVINLKSPIFFLLQQIIPGGYSLRVTSRFWFFIQMMFILFFAKAIDTFPKKMFYAIAGLILLEFLSIDAVRLHAPNPFGNQQDGKIYPYLKKKYHGKKVYTTAAFLSQFYTAGYGIELVAGESPWQNAAYIKKLKAAGGYPWFNEYAVIYPPWQAAERKSQPNGKLLAEINGAVVLSTYALTDKCFKYVTKIDKIKVYENSCLKY